MKEREKTGKMRLLITYKGSADIEENVLRRVEDDFVVLALNIEGTPESLATATINFPEINGKSVLFIHDIMSHDSDNRELLLSAITSFAQNRGYGEIYINSARQPAYFLAEQGFWEQPGGILAQMEVRTDNEPEDMEMD